MDKLNNIKCLFQGTVSKQQLKLRNRCFTFAVLVAIMVYIFPFTAASFQALVISQVIFLFWVALTFIFKIREMSFSHYDIAVCWILGLILIGNLWINKGNYNEANGNFTFAATHVGGVIAFAFAAQWAVRNLQPQLIFEFLAWILSPLIVLALALWWPSGNIIRIAPFGIHPNWWGEMAFGFIMCTFTVRLIKVRIAFIVCALLLIYAVQSRGALFSALVSIFTYWFLGFRPFKKTAIKRLTFAWITIGSIVFLVAAMGWWPYIMTFGEQRVLLLYDPYRGLGTSLTGRMIHWKEAITIFWENPIFGHGFDTLNYVHNGFLRFAAEGGILLFGIMIAMIISSMVYAWRQRIDVVFASLLGMVAYFMTYPRALNLNIVGIIFLLTLFRWKKIE